MSNFLRIALGCAARGWYVHPLKPGNKTPITAHGKNDATTNEGQIREWWAQVPKANVGIACGPSRLCVLDIDKGLTGLEGFNTWRIASGLPETYTVRTGRRPDFGAQMYFHGPVPDVGLFELNGCSGQVKSLGGLVLAAGCLHPSGEYYEVCSSAEIQPTPDIVRKLQKPRAEAKPGEPIRKLSVGEGRHPLLMGKLGELYNLGLTRDGLLTAMVDLNEVHCADPKSLEELESMVDYAVSNWTVPPPEPRVVIGQPAKPEVPKDWRTHYHSFDDMENAPPPTFLIDGFLQADAITALAAPVSQRKSLIALNVAHALCTKDPLFGHFPVTQQPARILYLCPEMGIRSFTGRVKNIGLMPYVGKTLFCRTMSADKLRLNELTPEELTGAVLIIDTAVRYLEGDENKSEHMRVFAEEIFRLMRDGAVSVLLLHHSAKGTKDSNELTLENAMRGSGELGAFVASCWATRLQDPAEPYKSASYMTNVKQRDYESKPFEVTSGEDCRLHVVPESFGNAVLTNGFTGKPDAPAAEDIVRANAGLKIGQIQQLLKDAGITRSVGWVSKKRTELREPAIPVSIVSQ